MFLVVWEFVVRSEKIAAFENLYGPVGSWATLFRKCSGFVSTSLLRDSENLQHYLTIDRWDSPAHHAGMHQQFAAEYAALDQACEKLTESEKLVGAFEELP
ncbi:MAG TPA: antibiotic biosynthesis monooxygenase, partial [Candidatus Acidoferrales bacterium]